MDPTTEQELLQMMSELRGAFSGMPNATKEAESGLKTFAKATGKGAVDIGKGLGSFALQVGKGDTSFKSLNKVIDVTAGALGGMAKALPVAGDAIAAGITAAAEAAKFMLDQMDQVAKGFNEMGSVGALTADGMTGLIRQFTQSGLGLQSFTKLVADNSQALAAMSGIVGDGAEVFSQAIGQLTQGNDNSLRKLGMNADQIGETVGVFVTQQTRLGRSQNMTATQLAEGAKQYAMELDKLGKLTGLSREQLQKEQDAALSDSRFRANYDEMVANGNKAQADAIMNLKTRFGRFDKELGQGIMDLTSGAANTESARKLMNSTGGAAQDIIARLKAGEIDEAQANKEIVASFKANKEKLLQIALFTPDADSAVNKFAGVQDAIAAEEKSNDQVATEMQKKQLASTDDLTKSTIEAQKSMEGLSRTITIESLKLLPQAAKATAAVAKQMNELAKYIADTLGGKKSKTPGLGGTMDGMSEAVTAGAEQTPEEEAALRASPAYAKAQREAAASRPGQVKTSQQDLKKMGLKIKEGDVQAEDSSVSGNLIELAHKIQGEVPGFSYFSGFNDKFHQGKDNPSKHKEGRAVDFALAAPPTKEEGQKLAGMLKSMGASYVKDEYNESSKNKTGGHIHAEVSAANGAILSGPMSGYTPNLTMHGTEAIVPINTPATNTASGTSNSATMLEQLAKMEELASIFRSQLAVDQKLLSYSS
jgi:hypothetical protein